MEWARRTEFVKKAHSIIRQCTYTGVGTAILKDDFDKAVSKEFAQKYAGLYSWCASICTIAIGNWCDKHNYEGQVNLVFEAGSPGAGQVATMLQAIHGDVGLRQKFHIGSWSFKGKDVLPLQAADTVAYEWYK